MFLRVATDAPARVGEQVGFAVEDRRRVLHRAGGEVRDGDDVELAERIFDGVVAVVERQDLLGRLERDAAELLLVGVAQMRIGMPSAPPLEALEIADGHRDQIRRHLRRGRERHRVLRRRPAAGVSESTRPFEIAVSPRSIVSVTAKVALKAGSSKHGKARRASVDFELRDRVVPPLCVLAQIEAAQLVVQEAACSGCESRRALSAARRGTVSVAVCGLRRSARRPRALRRRPAAIVTSRNAMSTACSTTARVGSASCDADRLGALEPRAREVDGEREVVVARRDAWSAGAGPRAGADSEQQTIESAEAMTRLSMRIQFTVGNDRTARLGTEVTRIRAS